MVQWTLAVAATAAAFIVHLALRGRTVDLGFRLGKARAEQARLREVKRVLELEAASHQTPRRVKMVARTLLGMTQDDFREVIDTYLDESQMIYVVVGDAETQLDRVAELGYGEAVLLDIYGRPEDP